MNLLQLIGYPLFIVASLEILLAVLLLRAHPRCNPVNRSVAAFSFFTAAFAFITALMFVRASFGHDVTFLARANWISWMMIPAALQFIFYMRDENSRSARLVGRILYPFWFAVFCVSLSTDLIERGSYALFPHVDRAGPLGKPLRLVGLVQLLWVMYEMYSLRRQLRGIKRAQLHYFTYGVLIFAGGGATLAGILQLFGGFGLEPGLGSYFSLPWVVLTFYAITRYRLFDMRTVISRVVSIALLTTLFFLVQTVLFKILEPALGATAAIAVSLFFIGFVFFATPTFSRKIQKWVQRVVLQNKFVYQQTLKESIKAIITILDLNELLNYLILSIKNSLGVENVCLFLKGGDGQYVQRQSVGARSRGNCINGVLDGSVAAWIRRTGQIVIREEFERKLPEEEFGFLNAYMKKAGTELFIPLLYKGNLQGVLTLGEKGNREPYAQSDIDLLEALAGHAAVAIENARLYEDARRVQESLRESQERFRNLIETTSDWVWEMNDRGVYTYVSPKIRDILGYEPEEVLGKTFFDFMPREEARRAADFFVSLTRQKKPFMVYQNTNQHKSGRLVVIETSGVPIFDQSGAFLGYRGIDRDVTQRNALEGQLRYAQKMEAIGRLAAGVAHDFNNIITAVVGYANLLHLKMKKDDPLRDDVDHILSATERAANLTQSLSAFGTKTAARMAPVRINDVVQSMEKLLAGIIRGNIDLVIQSSPQDPTVTADPAQIERVIMNLVTNARDAMPGGGRLIIETKPVDLDDDFITTHGYGKLGPYALIAVTDTGMGMEESTQKKIFEPFFTTKGVGKGTGFGLSVVYDIVKQHRGYINVSSAPGRGSTFKVYLPEAGTAAVRTTSLTVAAEAEKNGMVLIAENDDDARNFIKAALEGAGYTVVEAVDGEDAVEQYKLHKDRIAFLILDLVMPKMNGREAYQSIRKRRPGIKALFTSSYTEDIIHQKGMLDEGMSFILKPFSSKDLLDRVNSLQGEAPVGQHSSSNHLV